MFGEEPSTVDLVLLRRSDTWRIAGAARNGALGLLVAPVVFLVPPHIPWAVGSLITGLFFAWRRWKERVTLQALDGACPRCGQEVAVARPVRLRTPHTLPCSGCQHEMTLRVP